MKTINDVLSQKHESKSKAELVGLLSNLSELITVEEYQKVSGVDPKTELDKLSKKELVAVIDDFRENYDAKWEANIANASTEIMRGVFGMMEADEARFGAMGVRDANFTSELGSIDFENLIGGPMQAAVKAQTAASLSTVAFIQEVGFEGTGPEKKLKMSDFSYKKMVPDTSEGAAEDAEIEESVTLKVPFISILNIPSLRIETLDIDFNVKLSSAYKRDISSEFGINSSLGINLSVVKFKVSSSYKRKSSSGVEVEKEYSMNVKVKATNDEMPAGLEKVLGMMSE